MRLISCALAASLAFTACMPAFASESPELRGSIGSKPQYVLISFDNSGSNALWERSRALAERSNAKFTYFLSCVFLIDRADRKSYQAPGESNGRSNIGYAASKADIAKRLDNIWRARNEGNEIASHACGHFDGRTWTKADWIREFTTYKQVLRTAWAKYGSDPEPEGWKAFVDTEVRGFRAPYLSASPALLSALKDLGYAFDASSVSKGPALPVHAAGLYQFALPTISEGPEHRPVVAMDYNMFVRHSGGFERADHLNEFENRAYDAFKGAFERQYRGERIPFQIGIHFTLMNGDAYWRALERFTSDVCTKPDVRCTTYSDYLKQTGAEAPVAVVPAVSRRVTGSGI